LIDAFQVVGIQHYVQRIHIFAQIFPSLGSRNWNDVFALRQDPGERQLGRSATFFRSDLAYLANEIQIALKVFSLKSGGGPPVIVRRKVFEPFNLAGKESAAKW